MIITTGKAVLENDVKEAKRLAEKWGTVFRERKKRSFKSWMQQENDCIYVVSEKAGDKLYHPKAETPFSFHPSMAWLRVQRLEHGQADPMVDAMKLQPGMRFLDCTLGFASDSIVASFVTNEYTTGLEKSTYVAEIVRKGLKHWQEKSHAFNEAMRRIQVCATDFYDFLTMQPDNAFDVVYLDPMFERAVESSVHFTPLRYAAYYDQIERHHVSEALRVAKRRVVIKSSFPHPYIEELGFTFRTRKSTASFAYAVLEKEGNGYE
ncbi:Putative SAM-dependent methyltransferase [Alteribacillus persepolensis]|uniref:Putative SAM-dependent methyltransferase n=1 Tax=Alteribacillus persepolensis TaxID=568899 RepID=A0A1G7YVN8_9BACI|nr:class I SAM-dependent methyltransferase [Alteribacillus persepolensis]SDH00578.1 Putative SAM-dependent methyltransferase [Alteribacillus persepolensis]